MTKQRLTFSLNPEMPTKDGSEDADDFLTESEGGIINKKPPALYPATSYPAKSRSGITGSGNNFTVYIKKSGQGVPICFKMRQSIWEPWNGSGEAVIGANDRLQLETDGRLWQTNIDAEEAVQCSWGLSNSTITHDSNKTSSEITINNTLAFGYGWSGEQFSKPIPKQQLFVNISASFSGGVGGHTHISVRLTDEHKVTKTFTIVANFDVSPFGYILLGNSTGENPVSLAPLQDSIIGVLFVVYSSDYYIARNYHYESDFITFR